MSAMMRAATKNRQARNELTSIRPSECFIIAKVLPHTSATVNNSAVGIDLCSLKFTFAYFAFFLRARFRRHALAPGQGSPRSRER